MPTTIASLAPVTLGATTYAAESIGLDPGIISSLGHHTGQEYPTLVAVSGAGPRVIITMPLRSAIDAIGLGVTRLTAADVYLSKFAALIKAAGSVHTKFALAASGAAAAQITGVSVSQDGLAMATVELVPLSPDGTTAPQVKTDNNALPTLGSQPLLHTAGPVSINGTVYPGLTAASVELAPTLQVHRGDGAPYPVVAARTQAQPSILLTHADPIAIHGILGALGANITANVVVYFRAYDSTTGAVGSSGAISMTIASGRVHPEALDARQGEIATTGLRVVGLSTSSTHPIAVATGASVPALP
ncbi:MAG: hypothetical protein RLZZ524_927 [Pseudomonadota bacterium]|jgi:hypothetical protein